MKKKHFSYSSVQRPVLFGGVPPKIIALELFFMGIVAKSFGGSHWWITLLIALLLHKYLSWLFKRDHQVLAKLNAYLKQPDQLLPGRTRKLPPGFGGMF